MERDNSDVAIGNIKYSNDAVRIGRGQTCRRFASRVNHADRSALQQVAHTNTHTHGVVQQNFTPEIEVFYMVFERSLSIFSMTSLKQQI